MHINFSRFFFLLHRRRQLIHEKSLLNVLTGIKSGTPFKLFLSSSFSHVRHNKLHFYMATQCHMHSWNSQFFFRYDLTFFHSFHLLYCVTFSFHRRKKKKTSNDVLVIVIIIVIGKLFAKYLRRINFLFVIFVIVSIK